MTKIKVTTASTVGNREFPEGTHDVMGHFARHLVNAGHAIYVDKPGVATEEATETEEEVVNSKTLEALEENGITLETAKTMTKEELLALDGIGESRANQILSAN